jgi:hypothetical protein
VCIAQGTTDGAAAASNRHGTYELWSPGPVLVSQMLWVFGGGHGVSIPHERRGSCILFCQLWPSLGITKGTVRRGGICCIRTWYVRMCAGWSSGPRNVWQMPRAFDIGHGVSIPHQKRDNWPLFLSTFDPLCVSPRAQTAGRRLLQTDLVCAQGGPKAPKGVADNSGFRRRVCVVDPAPETG